MAATRRRIHLSARLKPLDHPERRAHSRFPQFHTYTMYFYCNDISVVLNTAEPDRQSSGERTYPFDIVGTVTRQAVVDSSMGSVRGS